MNKTRPLAQFVAILTTVSLIVSGLGFVGCKTAVPGTPVTSLTPQQLDDIVALLKGTTSSALVLVIQRNGLNARSYVALTKEVVDHFLLENQSEPGAFEKALYSIPVKELKKPEVALVISTLTTAYTIYYGHYAKGKVGGNLTAVKLLTAVRDGAVNALQLTQ